MSVSLAQPLPDIPFLRAVPEGPRAAFLAGGRLIEVLAGTQIMRQGEPAGALLVLLEGRLRVSVMSLAGRELTFRMLGPVQPVGEVAMLDGGPRTADVLAVSTCRLLMLPREHCQEMMTRHASLGLALIRVLCERLRDTSLGLERVATQRLASRMAHLFLKLAGDYGRARPDGLLVPMRLSQGEIAAMVAGTREAVNKQLAEWRQAGVLAMDRGQVIIRDAAALSAACE
ncbi:MAG: Crp/Fnr family transcriptional regulator [Roseococcus sp.]|nr:Crp/Fnr family transcriptional regulator [Roseococcus sp.]